MDDQQQSNVPKTEEPTISETPPVEPAAAPEVEPAVSTAPTIESEAAPEAEPEQTPEPVAESAPAPTAEPEPEAEPAAAPTATVTAVAPATATPVELNRTEKFKRSFFEIMIGCLVGAAAIAVIAVLAGSFTDILSRALGTIALVALHAVISFGYIAESEKQNKRDGGRSIELFSNTVFVIIVLSFVTSVFGVWSLAPGEFVLRLYMLYGVILFATLHGEVLYRIRGFEKKIDNLVHANYVVMAIVVAMLMLVIFTYDATELGDFFYRLLSAIGIVDATMTITAIIMHKLYMQKHPELATDTESSAHSKSFWRNPLVILLMIFLGFQLLGAFMSLIFSSMY